MIKKILIALVLLAAAAFFAVSQLTQRAPDLLRHAIEKALNKKVIIQGIEYHFPAVFDLEGFEIQESDQFEGEQSFYADQIRLEVSPLSLSSKTLIIDKIEVENANIVIRKFHGKAYHALSETVQKTLEPSPAAEPAKKSGKPSVASPLQIRQLLIKQSNFKLIDYDTQKDGFVIVLDKINASVQDLMFPFTTTQTSYKIGAELVQGRDQRPGRIEISGWTVFHTLDTDAILNLQGAYLPYFQPYYGQVTQATIEDGYLDARSNLRIEKKELALNVDLEIINLLFHNYESGDELFGLKADEILSFLKDRSGRLKLQIVAGWNIADRSVKAKTVIRKSIERSLKSTILGNIGNILQKTIEKISEKGGFEEAKNSPEGVVNRIKSFLRK